MAYLRGGVTNFFPPLTRHRRSKVRTRVMAAARAAAAAALSMAILAYLLRGRRRMPSPWKARGAIGRRTGKRGLLDAIGNTPLIRIKSLSEATGCEVCGFRAGSSRLCFLSIQSVCLKLGVMADSALWWVFVLQILAKAEFLNPGGSVKDRVAVKIIEEVSCSGVGSFLFFFVSALLEESAQLYSSQFLFPS